MSSSNLMPAALGNTVIQVDPPYSHQLSLRNSVLTWNQPSSSPLATLSPGFFDHPMLPTSIAPTATNAMGTAGRLGPRLAWMSITDRLFNVNTLRSASQRAVAIHSLEVHLH